MVLVALAWSESTAGVLFGYVSVKHNVTQTLCFSSYLDLQVVSLVLGFMSGNWTLTPYVCSHMVGVERLAEAHGILMFFGGVGLTLGPPVVGKVVSGSGLVSVR